MYSYSPLYEVIKCVPARDLWPNLSRYQDQLRQHQRQSVKSPIYKQTVSTNHLSTPSSITRSDSGNVDMNELTSIAKNLGVIAGIVTHIYLFITLNM